MSKVLIVQPFRMVQQAMVLCLTSEHEVVVTDALPAIEKVKDFDVVIVDGTVVDWPSKGATTLPAGSAIAVSRGDAFAEGFPSSVETLNGPLTRDNLRDVVRKFVVGERPASLSPADESKAPAPRSSKRADRTVAEKRILHEGGQNVIELVEVVDEPRAVTDSN